MQSEEIISRIKDFMVDIRFNTSHGFIYVIVV